MKIEFDTQETSKKELEGLRDMLDTLLSEDDEDTEDYQEDDDEPEEDDNEEEQEDDDEPEEDDNEEEQEDNKEIIVKPIKEKEIKKEVRNLEIEDDDEYDGII